MGVALKRGRRTLRREGLESEISSATGRWLEASQKSCE